MQIDISEAYISIFNLDVTYYMYSLFAYVLSIFLSFLLLIKNNYVYIYIYKYLTIYLPISLSIKLSSISKATWKKLFIHIGQNKFDKSFIDKYYDVK